MMSCAIVIYILDWPTMDRDHVYVHPMADQLLPSS